MELQVVAISGWKQSGKDTAADYLINEHGFRRFAFADVLKKMTAEQYDIPLNYCYDNDLKEKPLSMYPVVHNDKFTNLIHDFMDLEFRNLNVTLPDGSVESTKCWTPRALLILEGSVKRSVNS